MLAPASVDTAAKPAKASPILITLRLFTPITELRIIPSYRKVNHLFSKIFVSLAVIFLPISGLNARTVAFFFALESDWQTLYKSFDRTATNRVVFGQSVFHFKTDSVEIFAIKMGAGSVQSAISAQALLATKRCDLAISVGPVGSLDPKLRADAWALVEDVVPWQKQPLQPIPGRIEGIQWEKFPLEDKQLTALARIRVASGEMFVASTELNQQIAEATACNAVDMNLFGILSVLQAARVPSIHLRIVSDEANESASDDFRTFLETYDGAGGKMAADFLLNLPPDKTAVKEYPELQKLFHDSENASGE
jgi:adenosylhomocysteine nucleosidase